MVQDSVGMPGPLPPRVIGELVVVLSFTHIQSSLLWQGKAAVDVARRLADSPPIWYAPGRLCST